MGGRTYGWIWWRSNGRVEFHGEALFSVIRHCYLDIGKRYLERFEAIPFHL